MLQTLAQSRNSGHTGIELATCYAPFVFPAKSRDPWPRWAPAGVSNWRSHGGKHEIPDRRPPEGVATGRDIVVPVAGADADRVERRVHAGAANRETARSRGAAQGIERPAGP